MAGVCGGHGLTAFPPAPGRTEPLADALEHTLEALETLTHLVRRDPGIRVQALGERPELVGHARIGHLAGNPGDHLGVPGAHPDEALRSERTLDGAGLEGWDH